MHPSTVCCQRLPLPRQKNSHCGQVKGNGLPLVHLWHTPNDTLNKKDTKRTPNITSQSNKGVDELLSARESRSVDQITNMARRHCGDCGAGGEAGVRRAFDILRTEPSPKHPSQEPCAAWLQAKTVGGGAAQHIKK